MVFQFSLQQTSIQDTGLVAFMPSECVRECICVCCVRECINMCVCVRACVRACMREREV